MIDQFGQILVVKIGLVVPLNALKNLMTTSSNFVKTDELGTVFGEKSRARRSYACSMCGICLHGIKRAQLTAVIMNMDPNSEIGKIVGDVCPGSGSQQNHTFGTPTTSPLGFRLIHGGAYL